MYITPLDKESYNFLEFLYIQKECSIIEIQQFLETHNLKDNFRMTGILFPLFEAGYLAIYNPKLSILDSTSFEKYINACQVHSCTFTAPDCVVCILPKGRAYVESIQEQIENSEKQIASLKAIADSATLQAELSKESAIRSEEKANSAKREANFAKIISILAIIIPVIYDLLSRYLSIALQ